MIYCTGVAKLKSTITGQVFEVQPQDLHWHTSPGPANADACHAADVDFLTSDGAHLVACTWSVWISPAGTESRKATEPHEAQVLQDFSYGYKK